MICFRINIFQALIGLEEQLSVKIKKLIYEIENY